MVNGSLPRRCVNPKLVNFRVLELFLVQNVLTMRLSGANEEPRAFGRAL
jgi:hypothetical protein